MKNLIKWLLGIFFLLDGLGTFVSSPVLGLFYIFVGLFLIPPILNYFEVNFRTPVPASIKYIIVIFGFLGVIVQSGHNGKGNVQTSDKNQTDSNIIEKDTKKNSFSYDKDANPVSIAKDDVEATHREERKPDVFVIVNSTEVFRRRFNSFMRGIENPLRIRSIPISKGEVNNAASITLTEHLAIVIQTNKKDNSIRSMTMIGQGDGTLSSGADIMLCMAAIIASTNPDIPVSDRGNIIRELGLFEEGVDLSNISTHTVRNGIRYYLTGQELMGLMFGAESVEEGDF